MFLLRAAFLVMFIVCISLLTACERGNNAHLLSTTDIARQVGIRYGDANAQITFVQSTEGDPPPHDLMYLMKISGHFHKGTLQAHSLSFSVLANKLYVWNVYAYDQAGHVMWTDREMLQ